MVGARLRARACVCVCVCVCVCARVHYQQHSARTQPPPVYTYSATNTPTATYPRPNTAFQYRLAPCSAVVHTISQVLVPSLSAPNSTGATRTAVASTAASPAASSGASPVGSAVSSPAATGANRTASASTAASPAASAAASASPSSVPAATGLKCFTTGPDGNCLPVSSIVQGAGRCAYFTEPSPAWGWINASSPLPPQQAGGSYCNTDYCNNGPSEARCARYGSSTTRLDVTLRLANVELTEMASNATRAALLRALTTAMINVTGMPRIERIVNAANNAPLWSRTLAVGAANVEASITFPHPSLAALVAQNNASIGAVVVQELKAPGEPARAFFASATGTTVGVTVSAPVAATPSATPTAAAAEDKKAGTNTGLIVGVIVGIVAVAAAVTAALCMRGKRTGAALVAGKGAPPSATEAVGATAVAPMQHNPMAALPGHHAGQQRPY